MLENAKAVFDPRTIVKDAKYTFSSRYNNHVMMESEAQEYAEQNIESTRLEIS